jgi:hypothetical protein
MFKNSDPIFLTKEELFESIFVSAFFSCNIMEHYLDAKGLTAKTFGLDIQEKYKDEIFGYQEPDVSRWSDELLADAKAHYRKSYVWNFFENIYDYAINGLEPKWHWTEVFDELPVYLQLIDTDYSKVDSDLYTLLSLAFLRYGIDGIYFQDGPCFFDGYNSDPIKIIALMAKLDQRTVRNAQSEGAFKCGEGDFEFQAIKVWLSTKKGFVKSQFEQSTNEISLDEVNDSNEFGELIRKQIDYLGNSFNPKVFISKHYSFDKNTISQLQQGIFNLPLNTARIIANQLSLNETEFLRCVMRVFFAYELSLIKGD